MEIVIEKFDKALHDRASFDCGVEVLNNFIKTRSNKEMKQHLNTTYVAVSAGVNHELSKRILGYYTLSAGSITFSEIPTDWSRYIPITYPIPVLRIGRLARDLNFPGLGSGLLKDALSRVAQQSQEIGIFGILVDAKDTAAKKFYEKYGFIPLLEAEFKMFLPIKTLLQTIKR